MGFPRILSANWGVPGSHTLAVARQRGVYSRLESALRTDPAQLITIVKD